MLNRFGRGGALTLNPGPISLKGLYIKDTSSLPQTAGGCSVSYNPISYLSLSASLLQLFFSQKSKTILNTSKSPLSHSILGIFNHKTFGEHTLEYAKTARIVTPSKNNNSYYLYSRASLPYSTWYGLQGIYAEPNFVGYYQDTKQLYASLGFPLIRKMQGTLSYNSIAYNLNINPQNGGAPRSQNIYGGISYSFPLGLYTSLYYNFSKSKDAETLMGYRTQYASLNGGKTFQNWTFQGIIELGNYQTLEVNSFKRSWQNYQFYTYYQPTSRQQYAIYTRLGYVQLSREINWARIYGVSSVWTSTPSLKFQILYEYTDQVYFRNYLSSQVQYTLKNQHKFELNGYINKETKQKKVLEFLLSYTIPWRLPIRKKKSKASIFGKAFKKELNFEENPYPNLLIHCNGMRTLTDKKGNFTFPGLNSGDYHLWAEEKTHNWASSSTSPQVIQIQTGEMKQTDLCFEHPASLQGEILLFNFSEEELEKQGYIESSSIVLESTATKERIFSMSDAKGTFSFEHLSPGRWILKVLSCNIPSYHYLETKEVLIDLFPGENKSITLKILPIKREIRMIDTDTVQSSND